MGAATHGDRPGGTGLGWSEATQPDPAVGVQLSDVTFGSDVTGAAWRREDCSPRAVLLLAPGGGQHATRPGSRRGPPGSRRAASTSSRWTRRAKGHAPGPSTSARPPNSSEPRATTWPRCSMRSSLQLSPGETGGPRVVCAARPVGAARRPDNSRPPVGFWGLSLGTAIGLPLVAAEPKIRAAVLGRASGDCLPAAARVSIPVEMLHQSDDHLVDRDGAMRLFDAIATTDNAIHVNRAGIPRCPSTSSTMRWRSAPHARCGVPCMTDTGKRSPPEGSADNGGFALQPQ